MGFSFTCFKKSWTEVERKLHVCSPLNATLLLFRKPENMCGTHVRVIRRDWTCVHLYFSMLKRLPGAFHHSTNPTQSSRKRDREGGENADLNLQLTHSLCLYICCFFSFEYRNILTYKWITACTFPWNTSFWRMEMRPSTQHTEYTLRIHRKIIITARIRECWTIWIAAFRPQSDMNAVILN